MVSALLSWAHCVIIRHLVASGSLAVQVEASSFFRASGKPSACLTPRVSASADLGMFPPLQWVGQRVDVASFHPNRVDWEFKKDGCLKAKWGAIDSRREMDTGKNIVQILGQRRRKAKVQSLEWMQQEGLRGRENSCREEMCWQGPPSCSLY